MSYPNRFIHALTFAALAILLLPALPAQTTTNNTKPTNHGGNTPGNHKDIMSTAPPQKPAPSPSAQGNHATTTTTAAPGSQSPSPQGAEVRTEKLNYKQKLTETQVKPGDDNDPKKHVPPATLASSPDNIQKKHVANATASPADDNNPIKHVPPGNSTSTSTSTSTTTPQAAQDNTKFKQEFGPTQANKKN